MSGPHRKGDKVRWQHAQGSSTGEVKEIHKEDVTFADQDFTGSEDDPVYIVESDATGDRAAHKKDALEPVD